MAHLLDPFRNQLEERKTNEDRRKCLDSEYEPPRILQEGRRRSGRRHLGGSLLRGNPFAFGNDQEDSGPPITRGDIAILRFLSAAEQIEADLWTQYSELGGTQDNEVSGVNGGNPLYTAALQILDGDMPQYIHDTRMMSSATINF